MITNVGDTAYWVAYLRALESERRDALFHDPFARRLAGARGRAITASLYSAPLLASLAIRTRVYDDWILDTVAREPVTTVLNLAAGLDARPYRLALPRQLRWIEVDLPAILAAKEAVLVHERAACSVERFAVDLADGNARRALFARVHGRSLVLTEGLLAYLDTPTVAALADDIRNAFADATWLLEIFGPAIQARQEKWFGKALREAHAEHKFAPAEAWEFFRARGWHTREVKSLFDEGRRFGREPVGQKLMRWLTPRRYEALRTSVEYAIVRPAPLS